MSKIIAIANQKGGVGKTTTSVNLAADLGVLGKKTLLVDIDPQGNTTSGVGIDRRGLKKSTYEMLIGIEPIEQVLKKTEFKNLDILPSNINLAAAELDLIEQEHREAKLKQSLIPVVDSYDYIIIDCPPALGMITVNALNAADTVLIPTQCEYYALEGISQLMNTIRNVKRLYNPHLDIEGVLLTMYDGRLNLTQQVVNEIKKFFPKKVFSSIIPRGVRLSEAPSFGKPIEYFDKGSKGAKAYKDLAKEIIKKNK